MSCINKMTIQGIRSYGPKEQDTQVIEFFTPVTLIIGQNGCGKTTIIECLKYATTSDMPPNTKGASFLFDPKLIDELETKGRIKLFFKDMGGLFVQVQKNMSCTQKQKKLEFRTLETIISRYDAKSKLLSTITSKCINADAEVINALGVSKAVLDHVIFCHQEDSNWPLSDGKLLKTRFDDIFAATKYIKALDVIKKLRLEKSHQIKQLDVERKHLEGYKTRADELHRSLEEAMTKSNALDMRKKDIAERLKPVQKQIDYFMQEASRLFEAKADLDRIENEKVLLEKQIKELLATTKDCLFVGDDDELKNYIRTFSTTTGQMRREEEEAIQQSIVKANSDLSKLATAKSKLTIQLGVMENKFSTYQERKKQMTEAALRVCRATGLDESVLLSAKNLGEIDPQLFNIAINKFITDYVAQTASMDRELKDDDATLQARIDSQRDLKSKLDQQVQSKKEAVSKCRRTLEQINDELKSVENDKVLNDLNGKIVDAEATISKETGQLVDLTEIKDQISQLETERSGFKEKEMDLDAAINKWHTSSKIRTEINMLRADKRTKTDQIRKMKLRIDEDLDSFFQHMPSKELTAIKANESQLKSVFEKECREMMSSAATLNEKRKDVEKKLVAGEMKRNMLNDDFRAKESQLRSHEDKLLQLNEHIVTESDIDKFDSILEKLRQEHLTLLDDKGFLTGTEKTYKRFIAQMGSSDTSDHSCPVCRRCFADEDEMNETKNELRKYIVKTPQKIAELDEKLRQATTKLDEMVNAKSIKEAYDKLKNGGELATVKSQLAVFDKDTLPRLRTEQRECDEQLKHIEARRKLADQLQNEIVIIDKYASECAEIDRKIETITRNNSQITETQDSNVDIDDLGMQKSAIQTEASRLAQTIRSKQEEITSHYTRTDRVNTLKERLNEMKTRRNELTMRAQKKTQLADKKLELEAEIQSAEANIDELNAELKTAVQALNKLINERQGSLANSQAILTERNKFHTEIRDMCAQVREQVQFVEKFESGDEVGQAKQLKREIKELEAKERDVNDEIERLREKLDEIKTELARYDIKQRELNDNLKLREKRAEHNAKNKQFGEYKEKLKLTDSNIDLKNFKTEQRKAEMRRDELHRELAEAKNSALTLEGRIQAIREELELDKHVGALEKFLQCSSDLKVLELSVLDMDKYYKALDKAIMSYHSLKMSEINKSIKQLWRTVYRGNDIDYVEIRSEEESPGGEEEPLQPIKTRRSYNYRVVLVKGETCLDMRGRCSAGQKVLASIIIRLALAETFCLNSGILALDEPTTNLDRENIESLASALVDIIKTRSSQSNFQLIIITHDEDFVEMLGRSEFMDQFYRVSKDENGFSRITKRSNDHL